MSSPLTPESPFILRINAWARERFPVVNFITGVIIYAMTVAVGRHLTEPNVIFGGRDVFGALALICQFFVLRVLDEHKDYEIDRINHPQRALQRGLINLGHLKFLGASAAIFQLGFSLYCDRSWGAVTWAWAAMTLWTLLMAKEFFCGPWLKKHLLLYAFSHMLVMPMTMAWALKIASPHDSISGEAMILIVLTLISGFAYEVTRKTRGVEEESATLDSYSKILGTRNAAKVILFLLFSILLTQFEIIRHLVHKSFGVGYGLILLGFLASVVSVSRYAHAPTLKARKANEGTTGLFMLINYTSIIVAVMINSGFRWRLK